MGFDVNFYPNTLRVAETGTSSSSLHSALGLIGIPSNCSTWRLKGNVFLSGTLDGTGDLLTIASREKETRDWRSSQQSPSSFIFSPFRRGKMSRD